MIRLKLIPAVLVFVLLSFISCQKNNVVPDTTGIYVPTSKDVTATATLAQLQQGRAIFVNNCGNCHGLPSPDSYSAANWNIILGTMIPRAGLSAADAALVAKYVRRGN
jgi:mono/diheme cytochrome c family protein